MSPLERYQYDIEHNDFSKDAAQLNAVKHLQRLHDELIEWHQYQTLPGWQSGLTKSRNSLRASTFGVVSAVGKPIWLIPSLKVCQLSVNGESTFTDSCTGFIMNLNNWISRAIRYALWLITLPPKHELSALTSFCAGYYRCHVTG